MIRLLDGPAGGNTLMLRRAPTYLRIVVDEAGKVDGLDQLEDEPAAGETIHVYRIRPGTRSWVHLNFGGSHRGTGFYAAGEYEHLADVDGELVGRSNEAWRAWAMAQPAEPEPVG